MPKDPAVLLYTDDFLAGSFTMTNAQVGAYIRLLCLQHQQGHLTEEQMLTVCKKRDPVIWAKFITDENGLYYNRRMESESAKRSKYSESRSNNRKGKTKSYDETHELSHDDSYESHMGNGNGIINRDDIKPLGNGGTKDARDLSIVMTFYEQQMGSLPSSSAIDFLKSYTEDMGAEVVCKAIDIAVDANARSWPYIKSILQNWTTQKVKSLSDVNRIEAQRTATKGAPAGSAPHGRKSFAELAAEEMEKKQ
jgi:DnaD/phage-associated family protein